MGNYIEVADHETGSITSGIVIDVVKKGNDLIVEIKPVPSGSIDIEPVPTNYHINAVRTLQNNE